MIRCSISFLPFVYLFPFSSTSVYPVIHRTRIENGMTYDRIYEWLKDMTKDVEDARKISISQLLKDFYGNGKQAVEEEELIDEI